MHRKEAIGVSASMVFALTVLVGGTAWAEVILPATIGSRMVLQQDMPATIWGWAQPGEVVTVRFDSLSAVKTETDEHGNWKVVLPRRRADGKAHRMVVTGTLPQEAQTITNTLQLSDILIGEVWLGSGQSNMERWLGGTRDGAAAIAAATNFRIRLLHVPNVQSPQPAKNVNAAWKVCSPLTVGGFSAVLYYFGSRIEKELNVPVGLINASWSGSLIEPWMVSTNPPGELYNAMIAPLVPFAIRGVLWYQGEANTFQNDGMKYFKKKKALIEAWRRAWGYDFPFYFVQLAPFSGYSGEQLQALWEAQAASLRIPGTGMAVTTDLVDNMDDIHPQNKWDVGNRLALWALARTYGRHDIVFSGPLYKGMKIEGNRIRLAFAHAKGGLKSRDGNPLKEFEIAGASGNFVAAEAVIDGETVVLQAAGMDAPTQARFGWSKTANPNLVNRAGLPASPFRTENWQGGTGE
ncbi:MAG: sialate O-acetylesterase [Lentisphaerae bacterium]|nr:sialate O-acetylesterase [Lentisphaerota bacterium]